MAKPLPVPVIADDGSMYRSAPKIYPREVSGTFQRLRVLAAWWLLGMFYLFPWLSWDGRQAVLFDLPARKFHIFGLTFWPQDFVFLSWLLIMAGFSLFFFTALAGRLWCGYACPQTVWTEVFLALERFAEGPRHKRMKLDAGPWTWEKLWRKSLKQMLWIGFAAWTGFTFVGFFTPIRSLAVDVLQLEVGGWALFWMVFYGLATYGNAGYLREQVCKYMCPYARFQGAMFDKDTLIISYDAERGEPRGSRRKGTPSVLERRPPSEPAGGLAALGTDSMRLAPGGSSAAAGAPLLGDCIDCTLCVQVCPTGIDIRNGLQYECIACGSCIDVCNEVMDKMGYPRGLVRYTTENALHHRPTRILRPRVLIYATLLLGLSALFGYTLWARNPLIVDVLRDRNALYRELADGRIENVYTLKLINRDRQAHHYRIELAEPAELGIVGGPRSFLVPAEQVRPVVVTLSAEPGLKGRSAVVFLVRSEEQPTIQYRAESAFFAPEVQP